MVSYRMGSNTKEYMRRYMKKYRKTIKHKKYVLKHNREFYSNLENRKKRKKYLQRYMKTYQRKPESKKRKVYQNTRAKSNYKYPFKQSCAKCGSLNNIEKHHTTYPITIDDFIFLCKDCHLIEHNRNLLRF